MNFFNDIANTFNPVTNSNSNTNANSGTPDSDVTAFNNLFAANSTTANEAINGESLPNLFSTPGGTQTTGTSQVNAVANNPLAALGEVLIPDAIVFGETHGPATSPLRGGNFVLFSTKDGSASYFGAKPIKSFPDIPTPWGPIKSGVSVVGTASGKTDEGGLGVSIKVPTPIGDFLAFANGRQDTATVGSLTEVLSGKAGDGLHTVSVNFGAAYSISDGALLAASGSFPPAAGIKLAADALGGDAWGGAAWRGSLTVRVENGQVSLEKVNISGVEIPINQLGPVLADQAQKQREKPTLIPNRGQSEIASLNSTLLAQYGTSPWDIADAAKRTNANGGVELGPNAVDVLNHDNGVILVAEPIYELGVKYGLLTPDQNIRSNAEAGELITMILSNASKAGPEAKAEALRQLNNPYGLNFGNAELAAYMRANKEPYRQDNEFVTDVYQGDYRHPDDL